MSSAAVLFSKSFIATGAGFARARANDGRHTEQGKEQPLFGMYSTQNKSLMDTHGLLAYEGLQSKASLCLNRDPVFFPIHGIRTHVVGSAAFAVRTVHDFPQNSIMGKSEMIAF